MNKTKKVMDKLNIKNNHYVLFFIISIIIILFGSVGIKSTLFNMEFVRVNDVTSRIVGTITTIPNNTTSTINGNITPIHNEQLVSKIIENQFYFYLADFVVIIFSIFMGIYVGIHLNNKRQHT